MVNTKTAFIATREFYSDFTTTIETNFFTIFGSPLTYVTPAGKLPYLEYTQLHFQLVLEFFEVERYILNGDFTATDYSIVLLPNTNEDIGHQQIEIWVVGKDNPIITGTNARFFQKNDIVWGTGTAYEAVVSIYAPFNQSNFSTWLNTWENSLALNMVPVIYI